jgi:hypothetical protein
LDNKSDDFLSNLAAQMNQLVIWSVGRHSLEKLILRTEDKHLVHSDLPRASWRHYGMAARLVTGGRSPHITCQPPGKNFGGASKCRWLSCRQWHLPSFRKERIDTVEQAPVRDSAKHSSHVSTASWPSAGCLVAQHCFIVLLLLLFMV